MNYIADEKRYDKMKYRKCGNSGLYIPLLSLGLWHNFGHTVSYENSKKMVLGAFDLGINHFDIANNYGPPPGSAEETFGKIINSQLKNYRDEIIVTTKAGYTMWPGPYGDFGSKKSLLASLNQSLSRLKLDYVDIFYHHRPDPNTPIEETVEALEYAVRSGKALYVGISNYSVEQTKLIVDALSKKDIHCLIHQMRYSMLNRDNEKLIEFLSKQKIGSIAFSPLAQGLLTGKYIDGVPEDSRAKSGSQFLTESSISAEIIETTKKLNDIAKSRGQSLTQMALAWVLRENMATSVIIGASKLSQIEESCGAIDNIAFSKEELALIDSVLKK